MRHIDFTIDDFDCDEGIFDIQIHFTVDDSEEEYQIEIQTVDQWNKVPQWWLEWPEDAWNEHRQFFMEKAEEEYKRFLRMEAL